MQMLVKKRIMNYIQPDFLSLYTPYTQLGNGYYDGAVMDYNINFAGSGNDTVYRSGE